MRYDYPTPFFVLFQGKDEAPLISPTVRAYVPLLSVLLIRLDVHVHQPSADSDHLPQILVYFIQQDMPLPQFLSMCTPPPLPTFNVACLLFIL